MVVILFGLHLLGLLPFTLMAREARFHLEVQQSLCADCHQDLDPTTQETTLLQASDFGTAHPELRPTVVVDPASRATLRVAMGAADFPKEVSNLRFPHDIHVAEPCPPGGAAADARFCTVPQMARQRLGKVEGLECADCHRPEPAA